MKKYSKKRILWVGMSLFCIVCSVYSRSVYPLFTIESSQKALLILKTVQEKCVEALQYMKACLDGYQVVMQDQKEIWILIQNYLQTVPLEIEKIVERIKIIEKDNEEYENLINQLFELLHKMETGICMYSEYMNSLDIKIKTLLEEQKAALYIVSEYQKVCSSKYQQ